jgi:FkbM family methyltransferase
MNTFEAINQVKACRHGQMCFNVHDKYVGRSLDLYGEYSEGEVDLFRQVVTAGQVVLDVGANIGAHTLFLARQVGPSGMVMAFEPQRILFQMLCANMAINSIMNTICVQHAVGAAEGSLVVPPIDYGRAYNFGAVRMAVSGMGEQVPVVPLDIYRLQRCDFIKIDVEGMELQVLAGARDLIARLRPTLYVENEKPEHADELIREIDALGYAMYWHTPRYFRANNYLQNPENVFGEQVSGNMLCVPAETRPALSRLERVAVPKRNYLVARPAPEQEGGG